jgi:hypothetical protein
MNFMLATVRTATCSPTTGRLTLIVLALCCRPLPAQAPAKALPSAAEIAESTKAVQEVYKAEYQAAKTNAAKVELARKLLKDAAGTVDDRPGKYVLLLTAKEVAALGGDLQLAYDAIDQLARDFDVAPSQLRAEAAIKASAAVDSPMGYDRALRQCYVLSQEALLRDDYALADELAGAAIALTKRVKDAGVAKLWVARQKEMQQMKAEFTGLDDSLRTLDAKPADPEANLALGKFRCFVQDDWKRGVPMLALGSAADLAEVAALELGDKTPPAKLGDGWWKLSESQPKPMNAKLQRHAASFYQKALPKLTGLAKTRIEQRLHEAPELVVPLDQRASGLMARAVIDCGPKTFETPLGRTFDLSQSWTLHFEFFTEQTIDQPKYIFVWGDERPGNDVLLVEITIDHLKTTWRDVGANTGESPALKFDSQPTGRWVNVKVRFDAFTRTMKVYLNDVLTDERERQVLPRPDRVMPVVLGGGGEYRFTGKIRELWFGNHD